MRTTSRLFGGYLSAVVCVAPQVVAADPLDCRQPVRLGESADALMARYSRSAKLEDFVDDGGSGTEVVLFPADPTRALHVKFRNETLDRAQSVEVYGAATGWLARGLHIGSTLAEVEAANAGPFDITAWGSDIGGFADFGTGKLGESSGRCRLAVRFDLPRNMRTPDGSDGDSRERLSSTDTKLRTLVPYMSALIVSFVEATATPRTATPVGPSTAAASPAPRGRRR